jgi:hypothetical protein
MISAYEHGQNAARHGKHIQACPFDPGTVQRREWCDGFIIACDSGIPRGYPVAFSASALGPSKERPTAP